ncbi:hypothetical protein AGMMS50239_03980 [Bacteroidia bacterium]|nr:hypothetical protein AGMMS50239_03980 [Bacteroidia bacterium]
MLSNYGIDNAGVRVKDKEKDIFEIETPCLITGNGNAACATLQDGQNLANRGFAVNCCLPNACCN